MRAYGTQEGVIESIIRSNMFIFVSYLFLNIKAYKKHLNIKYSKTIGKEQDRILNMQTQYLIFKMRPHSIVAAYISNHA